MTDIQVWYFLFRESVCTFMLPPESGADYKCKDPTWSKTPWCNQGFIRFQCSTSTPSDKSAQSLEPTSNATVKRAHGRCMYEIPSMSHLKSFPTNFLSRWFSHTIPYATGDQRTARSTRGGIGGLVSGVWSFQNEILSRLSVFCQLWHRRSPASGTRHF